MWRIKHRFAGYWIRFTDEGYPVFTGNDELFPIRVTPFEWNEREITNEMLRIFRQVEAGCIHHSDISFVFRISDELQLSALRDRIRDSVQLRLEGYFKDFGLYTGYDHYDFPTPENAFEAIAPITKDFMDLNS